MASSRAHRDLALLRRVLLDLLGDLVGQLVERRHSPASESATLASRDS